MYKIYFQKSKVLTKKNKNKKKQSIIFFFSFFVVILNLEIKNGRIILKKNYQKPLFIQQKEKNKNQNDTKNNH
ncbi:MAG: hypothetical protein EAZ31_08925 [Cytophagia bacterium]|nr:MAG: hypothetical protein EAZ31_08925 [Cytophagia bacterium]